MMLPKIGPVDAQLQASFGLQVQSTEIDFHPFNRQFEAEAGQ